VNILGQYYHFIFVKDSGFRKAMIESGSLITEQVEGKSYDEIIATIDPDEDDVVGELLFDDKVARSVSFGDDFTKAFWFDVYVFEPYMPEQFYRLIRGEFDPSNYIAGSDIDEFITVMKDIYMRVKANRDSMQESEEKEGLERWFLKDCRTGIVKAQKAVFEGFCDRIVVGWA
jgi:hypothetical protein